MNGPTNKREETEIHKRCLRIAAFLILILGLTWFFGSMTAQAEDLVIDTPFKKYVDGSIYGRLYIQYPEKVIPVYPPQSNTEETGSYRYYTKEGYGYMNDNETGTLLYRIHPDGNSLTIYGEAFAQAIEKQEGLTFRLYDKDGKIRYIIRYRLEDIEAYQKEKGDGSDWKFEMQEIRFEESCSHDQNIQNLLGDTQGVILHLCQNKDLDIPAYIGVEAPEGWEQQDICRYDYKKEGAELVRSKEDVYVAEEENVRMIESRIQKMTDVVYTKEEIKEQKLNAKSFAAGVSGDNSQVNRWYVGAAAVLVFAGAGILVRVFKKKGSGKGPEIDV